MIKLKKFNVKKKILAVIFIITMLIGNVQPIFAVDSSGSGKWVAGQYDSGIKTTDNQTNVGMLIRRLVNYTTGERITVFCGEHFINSPTGTIETATHSAPTDSTVKRACKIAYFGWYSKHGDYVVDGGIMASDMYWVKMDYVFTQQYVWEALGQSSATFKDATIQSQYNSFKAEVDQKMSNMERRPSFVGSTITVECGTNTITDSNNVLKDYNSIDRTADGIRIMHNKGENSMTIIVDDNCAVENYRISDSTMKSWGMIKEESRDNDTTIFFTFREGVQDQLYAMNYNDPVTMSLALKINLLGNIEISKINTNGDLIDGSVFQITGDNNYNNEVTVRNGKIKIEKLKKGIYTIKEKSAPYGYLLNEQSYNVEVKPNQTATQAVVNEEPTGTFTLTKKNADGTANIGGTRYRVWSNNGYNNRFTTNDSGTIKIELLKLGTYYYQEEQASNGYLVDSTIYSFELKYKDQFTKVIYDKATKNNKEPTGAISIIKRDSQTGGVPQGNATFNGAKYELFADEDIYNVARTKKYYSKGDLVATRTMDELGNTSIIEKLPLGIYKVKEKNSSLGYLLDTKEYKVELKYKDQNTKVITGAVTSNEVVKKMQVHIFKSGIKVQSGLLQGLKDVEFTFKLASDMEKAYQAGYSYEEIWNGIDQYGNKVTVNNTRVAEAQVIAPTYDTIKTDDEGNAYSIKLPYGRYIGKETKTPKDFETASDFSFSITQDESEISDIAKKVKHLNINNEQLETYIKLIKKDLKTGKTVTASSATFKIKAKEDIYDRGNSKIVYKKGEEISQKVGSTTYTSFTTNSDNIIVPDNSYNSKNDNKGTVTTPLLLPVGSYEICEIITPDGFIILENPISFKVEGIRDYDTDKDGDFIKTIEIKNEQPTGTLVVDKSITLRENLDTSLVDTSDYSNIQFRLTAKENIIDKADNSVIYEKDTEIGIYNLDKNGDLRVENLPMGKYELQEIKTLDGLILNDIKHIIEFKQTDNITKVYAEIKEIQNETTIMEFSKTDITGESELAGAKLKVLDEQDNVVDNWTSTDKPHTIEGLVVGKTYTLREEIAPEGYVKATDIKFTVINTTEIQKVEMIDKIVEMSKIDIAGKEVVGAKLKVLDDKDNLVDSWTSSEENHRIKGLEEGKTYTLYEEYAPEGYVISNKIEFTVTEEKKTQKIEMIDKVVVISKKNIAGDEIEGATLKVIDKEEKIIDEWVSSKVAHTVRGLKEGETYTLHEEITAEGYVKATDIKFTVSESKETQKVEMIDKIVIISKIDITTGKELEGAELKVIDEQDNIIDSWTSGKEPHIVVGLEENKTYRLVEETAPYGYLITESIEFTVSENKETQKIIMKDMPILKTIKLSKIDEETKEIIKEKFSFGLYENKECTKLIKEIKSDKKEGTATFEELRYGIYYAKEISAPKGYNLSDKIVKIEINDKGVFVDDVELKEIETIYSFEFTNKKIETPKTGDERNLTLWSILFGISGIGLLSIGIFKIIKRKKRK